MATRTSGWLRTAVSISAVSAGSLISSAQLTPAFASIARDSYVARQSGRRTVAAPDGVSDGCVVGGAMRFFPLASESKNVRTESSDLDGARHAGGASTCGRL